jgi:hypothetical protein
MLRQHPCCSEFIKDFLDLVEFGMLQTSPEKRFDSSSCIRVLEPLCSKLNLDHNYGNPKGAFTLKMWPPTGEDRQNHDIKSGRTKCPASYVVVEEESDRLEFTLHDGPHSEKPRFRFSTFRTWLDRQTGAEIDWWPLPRVHQELPQGHMRVTWVVSILDAKERSE